MHSSLQNVVYEPAQGPQTVRNQVNDNFPFTYKDTVKTWCWWVRDIHTLVSKDLRASIMWINECIKSLHVFFWGGDPELSRES